MSVQVDCSGCASGNHAKHQWDWGIMPGVLGGQSCACQGDCPERLRVSQETFNKWFGESL